MPPGLEINKILAISHVLMAIFIPSWCLNLTRHEAHSGTRPSRPSLAFTSISPRFCCSVTYCRRKSLWIGWKFLWAPVNFHPPPPSFTTYAILLPCLQSSGSWRWWQHFLWLLHKLASSPVYWSQSSPIWNLCSWQIFWMGLQLLCCQHLP